MNEKSLEEKIDSEAYLDRDKLLSNCMVSISKTITFFDDLIKGQYNSNDERIDYSIKQFTELKKRLSDDNELIKNMCDDMLPILETFKENKAFDVDNIVDRYLSAMKKYHREFIMYVNDACYVSH